MAYYFDIAKRQNYNLVNKKKCKGYHKCWKVIKIENVSIVFWIFNRKNVSAKK